MANPILPQPIDWDFLLAQIRDEKCLLIVGHEIFSDAQGETVQSRLIKYLDLSTNPHIKRYYSGEDFYLFDHKSHRTQFCHQIKKFYRGERPGELPSLLADIPFHVFLTVTPDLMLPEVFQAKNYPFQHGFYKKNTDPQAIRPPSAKNPLIYNLFGCVENEESLVLSHDDLYDYFKSIFARRSMPTELKDELREIRNLLFVGVPFDKWYLQILLRELEIHNQNYAFTRFATNQSVSSELSTFCFEQFQIQFVDKNVEDFIRELHRRCATDPDISFRKSAGPTASIYALVQQKISTGDTEGAIELLTDFLDGSPLQDATDKLAGRFGRLKKRRIAGILSQEEIRLEENRINDDLLELVKKVNT